MLTALFSIGSYTLTNKQNHQRPKPNIYGSLGGMVLTIMAQLNIHNVPFHYLWPKSPPN